MGARELVRWAALVTICYFCALGAWIVLQPAYLAGLRAVLLLLQASGILSSSLAPVVVSGQGLAVLVPGGESLAVPQRILGADFALALALIAGTHWQPWSRRAAGAGLAAAFVFAAHLATMLAQYGTAAASEPVRAAWSLWMTLYQGKVVPLIAWGVFLALSMGVARRRAGGPRRMAGAA